MLTGITASADVLGEQNGGWSTYMGAFTYFHNVQFNSDSVGKQNEYYVEYTPNEDAVPIVVNGASIWGTRNIKQAEQYMQENGLSPLAGINADYFSFKDRYSDGLYNSRWRNYIKGIRRTGRGRFQK